MIKSLYNIQSGFLSPRKFTLDEITKRCYSMQLSRHQDLECVHSAGVNFIDLEQSECRYLLSGCADGSIYIHDVNNTTCQPYYSAKCVCKVSKNSINAHRYSVECVSWYGVDSTLFITSGADKTLKIWDANSLQPVEKFHSKGRIFHHECSVVPTANPIIAVVGSVNHVELIDLRTGGSTHELRGHNSSLFCCSWSPVEEYLLATGGIDKKILLWDIRSSNSCLKQLDKENKIENKDGIGHNGFVNGLKFTTDGLFLISFGTDNKLRLWETLNGYNQEVKYCEVKNDVKKHVQFAISDNSKPSLVYIPSEGNIFAFEILSGKLVNILNGHFHTVNCCLYRNIYQELYSGGNDRNILVWTADGFYNEAFLETDAVDDSIILPTVGKDDWSSDEED